MNRSIIYVLANAFWMYGIDYCHGKHKDLGKYQSVIIGEGWRTSEITQMVNDFVEENLLTFED